MKQKIRSFLLAGLLAVCFAVPCAAESYTGSNDWKVNFNGDAMESNFQSSQIDEAISGMQPGDTVTFTLAQTNTSSETTDWYMTNKVLQSLEDTQSSANSGAYSYDLRYTDASGAVTVLYTSSSVGGEKQQSAGKGLNEATDSLDEYFYLDTLSSGQSGKVDLAVSLDGDTQGNGYQDTRARLQMNFAVELRSTSPTKRILYSNLTPKTGDTTPIVLSAVCGIGGLVLLILCLLSIRRDRKKKAERSHA